MTYFETEPSVVAFNPYPPNHALRRKAWVFKFHALNDLDEQYDAVPESWHENSKARHFKLVGSQIFSPSPCGEEGGKKMKLKIYFPVFRNYVTCKSHQEQNNSSPQLKKNRLTEIFPPKRAENNSCRTRNQTSPTRQSCSLLTCTKTQPTDLK